MSFAEQRLFLQEVTVIPHCTTPHHLPTNGFLCEKALLPLIRLPFRLTANGRSEGLV